MSENEINDNLMMLKYFLQEEGDENWEDYCNAIQGILNLYNKEKEKNKELMSKIDVTNWQEKISHEILDEKYISKDKIKEKIEFYKRYGKIKNSNEYVMSVEIEVLQELLEERN